ncbi:MAG: cytidine/deoxycytidylate deaminase family protein [Candidatus Cloacimonetes bacterium]|jgi:dCMP deaminase|nr:cytidine/deoxycytidylate deaminase family protein [Candidatus Cloacimonadota bacterium]
MNNRPSWHQYFMEMALLASTRSTCLRRQVGAIIVKDNQIISSGYNGAPKHIRHCAITGCLREQLNVPSGERHELCRGVHAEQNAVIQAAINGTSIRGASLYCTNQPCVICSKILINAEIKTIYITEPYEDKLSQELLAEAEIEMNIVDRSTGMLKKLL